MNRGVLDDAQAISVFWHDSFGHNPDFYYCPKQREPDDDQDAKLAKVNHAVVSVSSQGMPSPRIILYPST